MCSTGEAHLGSDEHVEAACEEIKKENGKYLAMMLMLGDVDEFDRVLAEVNGVPV